MFAYNLNKKKSYVSSKTFQYEYLFFRMNLIDRLKMQVIIEMRLSVLFIPPTLPRKKKLVLSKSFCLESILQNQRLSGGVFQSLQDTAFQNLLAK